MIIGIGCIFKKGFSYVYMLLVVIRYDRWITDFYPGILGMHTQIRFLIVLELNNRVNPSVS